MPDLTSPSDPAFNLLNAAPDAMILVGRHRIIEFVNQQFETLFEYRAASVVGRSIDILLPPELRACHARHVAAFWTAPERRPMSTRRGLHAMTSRGERLPVEISLGPLERDGEQLVLVSIRRASQRPKLDAALAESEADLRRLTMDFMALLESTGDFVYFKNRDHQFTAVSQSLAEATGHGHWRDLIGKTDFDIFPKDHAQRSFAAERHVIEHGSGIAGLETCYRNGDGDLRWVISDRKPLRNSDGAVVGLFGISKDVTDLKKAAAALAAARDSAVEEVAQRKQVFMDATDPILIEDLSGRVIDLNRAAERAYGWSREQLIGKSVKAIVPSERHHHADELLRRCLDGEEIRSVEGLRRSKTGAEFAVLLTLSRLTNDAGEPVAVATIAKDITALKRAEAELQEYSRTLEERVAERTRELRTAKDLAERAAAAKSVFLATMSHELRTPINGVTGMLELLALTDLDPEQRGMLGTIRGSADTLMRVIDDVLDFSKIEAGELRLEIEPLDLPTVINDVQRVMSPAAARKSLLLVVDIGAGVQPVVRGDPVRLRQILFNLISNAIKSTVDGKVAIRARARAVADDRQQLTIQVEDTGVGVRPDKLDKLFKPFNQGDNPTTRRRGGTGLGLAICQRLVGMMGGAISMESEVGKGTVVTIVLTLDVVTDPDEQRRATELATVYGEASEESLYRQPPTIGEAERSGRLVLVAEDHETNRRIVMQQLAKLGFAAEAVTSGAEALDAWRSGRFGLLLTDCHMPDMDGYMLARRIRQIEATQGGHIPIVAVTASAMSGEADKCRDAGADDYMAKPVPMHVMARKLSRWIQPGVGGDMTEAVAPARSIDTTFLKELVGSDPTELRELLVRFRQTSMSDLVALRQAVGERRADEVAEVAHRIKGAASVVGARELSQSAADTEAAGRCKDWSEIEVAVERLCHAFGQVDEQLDAPCCL